MAPKTFHCFLTLPYEIRREIYWLATPPRIVRVKEKTAVECEDFMETLRTHPAQLQIHPDIEFFSVNCASEIRKRMRNGRNSRQTTLEEHGITGGKPIPQPWTPSAQCPETPLAWLSDNPEVAWELVREGYLYSKAPIPTLLHTCVESRRELVRGGYNLAFATRTAEPRTWFHFDRDTLFLSHDDYEKEQRPRLLSGGPWDVGQFAAADLRRVRRLALERSACVLYDAGAVPPGQNRPAAVPLIVSLLLRLLGAVEELWFVEWTLGDVEDWPGFPPCFPPPRWRSGRRVMPAVVGASVVDAARGSGDLLAVDVELVDVAGLGGGYEDAFGFHGLRSGFGASQFVDFMENRGGVGIGAGAAAASLYAEYLCRLRRDLLERQRAVLVTRGEGDGEAQAANDDTTGCWRIPETRIVHVLPRSMVEYLYEERRRTAAGLSVLQTEWANLTKQELCRADGDSVHLNSTLSKREEFEERHWRAGVCRDDESCQGSCIWRREGNRIKKWWVQHGPSL
ncbi:hypothetical protein CORC01_11970 [Colletotrichum orchidophilum]|uniref:2EXR domain-containing protein n=1 Tax=Colletotrichum orchidophilum TaxID=1209926 RepID=A0A1G4AUL5_9PEZI|nr:uncharacterized protein CORC01_11970 [Colletotrichum orchidophilum]OHE92752.1 hypothetical protein CORC01_11970 [Colletotrichum orchidophilum]